MAREPDSSEGSCVAGGLFDGFEAYRTPSAEDYRALLTSGLVVLDTNVLLNLYRYNSDARDSLLNVLNRVADQLWVPHQVIREFWARRHGVMNRTSGIATVRESLTKLRIQAEQAIGMWANEVSSDRRETDSLKEELRGVFDEVIQRIAESGDGEPARHVLDTGADPVIQALSSILDGRVARAPTADVRERDLGEARRRIQAREPPGYKDAGKTGDGAAGDYLIWAQTLAEAADRRCPVLFVTGDQKEDWWRLEQGHAIGPRPELAAEMLSMTGSLLYMIGPQELMRRAGEVLRLEVGQSALDNVERVQLLQREEEQSATRDARAEPDGGDVASGTDWRSDAITAVLAELERQGFDDRVRVIRRAAELDGFIGRREIYEAAGMAENQVLTSFTRPIDRVVASFQSRELISPNVDRLLSSVTETSSGQLSGYRVPASVARLLTTSDGPKPFAP